jgi:DNA-directed RNA polymerase subunit RPC12/RpoP
MAIVVRCSDCGTQLKFRDDALGKKAKCTKCGRVVEIRPDGEPPEAHENNNAVFFDDLPEASTRVASPGKRREVKANPQSESAATSEPKPVKDRADEQILLGVRLPLRIVVLVLLLVPVVLTSRRGLPQSLMACIVPLILTGTYRTSKIRGDRFTTRFHLAFVPVTSHRCNLRGVTFINAKYGHEGSGWGTVVLFGPLQALFGRLFDFLMPSIGGPYQIHLVTAKGGELTAWQGHAEPQFRSMLDLLLGLTHAELRSM